MKRIILCLVTLVLIFGMTLSMPNELLAAKPASPTTGTWSVTDNMTIGRVGHTATLLLNDKVLVVGGCASGYGGPVNSAELYDSTTGSWVATGNLNVERFGHTSTLLPNGKVLVTGGVDGQHEPKTGWQPYGSLNSSELYDPATGIWTATGSLNVGRFGHTATLLANGKVLVAGGENGIGGFLGSAELYDPITGIWSPTGSMNIARSGHTATLLPNGTVLVVGGFESSEALSSSELYDPKTGTWSATSNLNVARGSHTATLLSHGEVLVAGGSNGSNYLSSSELYDPHKGRWSTEGDLNVARDSHTATLLANGEVLVAGGENGPYYSGGLLALAELYDPKTGIWSPTSNMNFVREDYTATLLSNGDVLVAGGGYNWAYVPPISFKSCELYTPSKK